MTCYIHECYNPQTMNRQEKEARREQARQESLRKKRLQEEKARQRRLLLKVGAGLAAGVAIGGGVWEIFNILSQGKITPMSREESLRYYPELKNFDIKANGAFKTTDRTVHWFNYSDYTFHPSEAAKIFSFNEQMAPVLEGYVKINTDAINYKAKLNSYSKTSILYILAKDMPNPAGVPVMGAGLTRHSTINLPTLVITREYTPEQLEIDELLRLATSGKPTVESGLNSAFFAEAFNSSIITVTPKGDTNAIVQEILCNSMTAGFDFSQNNKSYGQYLRMINKSKIIVPNVSVPLPYLPIPESVYKKIPQGKPFSRS